MTTRTFTIILAYAIAILGAASSATFPALFDSIVGVFGIPPGLGAKVSLIAFAILGLVALVQSKLDNVAQSSKAQTTAADAHATATTALLATQKDSTPV